METLEAAARARGKGSASRGTGKGKSRRKQVLSLVTKDHPESTPVAEVARREQESESTFTNQQCFKQEALLRKHQYGDS